MFIFLFHQRNLEGKQLAKLTEAQRELIEEKTTCHFCKSKEGIQDHHIIPEWVLGPTEEENLLPVCPSCHQQLDNLTRMWIETDGFGDFLDKLVRLVVNPEHTTKNDLTWFQIFLFVLETFVPRWNEHKWKTIEDVVREL